MKERTELIVNDEGVFGRSGRDSFEDISYYVVRDSQLDISPFDTKTELTIAEFGKSFRSNRNPLELELFFQIKLLPDTVYDFPKGLYLAFILDRLPNLIDGSIFGFGREKDSTVESSKFRENVRLEPFFEYFQSRSRDTST
jgi:hypothetical protein